MDASSFICPISLEIMKDPVIGPDGHSYDRDSISAWLASGQSVSPLTRLPLNGSDLIPNHALRNAIEEYQKQQKQEAVLAVERAAEEKKDDRVVAGVELTASHLAGEEGTVVICVQAEDVESTVLPTVFIDVLDVSYSMHESATETSGDVEDVVPFSRLDLVKHSVRTQIELMRDTDYLAIVIFDNTSEVLLPVVRMNKQGKQTARQVVDTIKPRGSTNIWGGLLQGLKLAESTDCVGKNVAIILQTDGESIASCNPPRGIAPSLQSWIANHDVPLTLHTVGYSYGQSLDMPLLRQLSAIGGGSVSYVPDGSMVGTVFIHVMANLMSVQYRGASLSIRASDGISLDGLTSPLPIGFINGGQPREFIIRYQGRPSDEKEPILRFELTAANRTNEVSL
jgi:hypothetical protein